MEKRDWSGLWIEPFHAARSYLAQAAPWTDLDKNGVATTRYAHEGKNISPPLKNSDPHPKDPERVEKVGCDNCGSETPAIDVDHRGWCPGCVARENENIIDGSPQNICGSCEGEIAPSDTPVELEDGRKVCSECLEEIRRNTCAICQVYVDKDDESLVEWRDGAKAHPSCIEKETNPPPPDPESIKYELLSEDDGTVDLRVQLGDLTWEALKEDLDKRGLKETS